MFLRAVIVTLLAVGATVSADEATSTSEPWAAQREQALNAVRQHCLRHADQAAADAFVNATTTFVECGRGIINVEQLKEEIEEAKPRGALDEVFKKYCDKSAQIKGCVSALTAAAEPCVEEAHRQHLRLITNATEQLIDFVCYKDGDRIAMFIAEQGPECLQQKADGVKECLNNVATAVPSAEVAESMPLTDKCNKFDTLSQCVVQQLEQCESPTPANMAEALFRFVRRGSPCKDVPVKN